VRYLSVCSGIEAASVAWHPLGWRPVAFSEIESFPSAVLAHHYPDVPNFGDMTRFKEWPDADVDVLVGGTPCQSFSVAGLRGGLADPRGNLALTYLAIAERYQPRWVVWENVPGVLSADDGRALGAFLGGLAELGYGFAWRVLDAQYFGLAQRRKRVFVVGKELPGQLRAALAAVAGRTEPKPPTT
jgi:DNA (cytosine-5)-methyltransferase 1